MTMARLTPDPTVHASPALAAAAPPETVAYVATLNTGSDGGRVRTDTAARTRSTAGTQDIAFRGPGRSRFAGEHRGRAAAIAYIEAARALAHSGHVTVELVDMPESRERVALIVHERFALADRDVEIRRTNVYRVIDDKIAEVWIFEADQHKVDAVFA
jgi:hypothetical protein